MGGLAGQNGEFGIGLFFAPNTRHPMGLKLVKDKTNHYCIAPMSNMPIDKYKGLLEEMALTALHVFKKEGKLA